MSALFGAAIILTNAACNQSNEIAESPAAPVTKTSAANEGPRVADTESADEEDEETVKVERAQAILKPLGDRTVAGKVEFLLLPEGVQIEARVSGLDKLMHGFHIHEVGDCSAADGSSAGGHYNPEHARHGTPLAPNPGRHAGDLGNLAADPQNGEAHYVRVDKLIALNGDNSIVGRAVVVHAGEDDFKTQPSGDAGARIACGVITAVNDR